MPAVFMVVGDRDVEPLLERPGDLLIARDAAVDRDDEVGVVAHGAGERLFGKRVAFLVAVRDEPHDVRAQRAQPAQRDGGGADAVDVEVAEDEDPLVGPDGGLYFVGDLFQPRDDLRVEPIAVERGCQELVGRLGRREAARHENPCRQRQKTAVDDDVVNCGLIDIRNAETSCFVSLFHATDCGTKPRQSFPCLQTIHPRFCPPRWPLDYRLLRAAAPC